MNKKNESKSTHHNTKLLLIKFSDEKISMLSNETTTKRHKTHITLTKEEVVGGTKQKDEQKKQTILKFILSPKYF